MGYCSAVNFGGECSLHCIQVTTHCMQCRLHCTVNCDPTMVTDAFSGMPKKSAAHRDGWTLELLRDAVQTPSTATFLWKFVERFSNGALPKDMWAYLASALLYPFHKKLPEERTSTTDPALRLVTVGSVLTRFGCGVMVRMNSLAVAADLLKSHQFSFDINGGVQQVILASNIALEIIPSWLMLDLD